MSEHHRGLFQFANGESIWFAVHEGVTNRAHLIDSINAHLGHVDDDISRADFCLILPVRGFEPTDVVTYVCEQGGLAIDVRWIWECLHMRQLLPWYQYHLGGGKPRPDMDDEERDLLELSTCLARHLSFIGDLDSIYLHLSMKFPHRAPDEFRELHEQHKPVVDRCVVDLAKRYDAIIPYPAHFHPSRTGFNFTDNVRSFGGQASTSRAPPLTMSPLLQLEGRPSVWPNPQTFSERTGFSQLPFHERVTSADTGEAMAASQPPHSATISDAEEENLESPLSSGSGLPQQGLSAGVDYTRLDPFPLPPITNSSTPFHNPAIREHQNAFPALPSTAMRKQKGRLGKAAAVTSIATATASAISGPYNEEAREIQKGKRRPVKDKYDIVDAPYEDSESAGEIDDEDYVGRGKGVLSAKGSKNGPRKSVSGRADPITHEEKVIVIEWVKRQAPETQRRQTYWEDFVQRCPIGHRRTWRAWNVIYSRYIKPLGLSGPTIRRYYRDQRSVTAGSPTSQGVDRIVESPSTTVDNSTTSRRDEASRKKQAIVFVNPVVGNPADALEGLRPEELDAVVNYLGENPVEKAVTVFDFWKKFGESFKGPIERTPHDWAKFYTRNHAIITATVRAKQATSSTGREEAQSSSTINHLAGQENSQSPLRVGGTEPLRGVRNDEEERRIDELIPGLDSLEGQLQPSESRPLLISENESNSDMSLDTSVAERELAAQAEPATLNGSGRNEDSSTARPAAESATTSHAIPAKPPTFNGPRKIKFTFKQFHMPDGKGATAGTAT